MLGVALAMTAAASVFDAKFYDEGSCRLIELVCYPLIEIFPLCEPLCHCDFVAKYGAT